MNAGKGIAGHQPGNGAPAPTEQMVQIPLKRKIELMNSTVDVSERPGGRKQLSLIDLSDGVVYSVQLTGEDSKKLGGLLMTSLAVAGADEMPGGDPS